jgi:WRKY transcription factor 33
VERASHDPRAVITTYEGKHNHDVPVGRAPPAAPTTTTGHNHPYTLETLSSSDNNGFYGAFQQQRAVTKDEPRDDLFVDSLLC